LTPSIFGFECRLDLLGRPAVHFLRDLHHREVRVPPWKLVWSFLLRRRLLLGRRLLLPFRGSDRLDLDLRELGAEAGVALVAALRLVLADPNLLPQRRSDDPRGHLRALRRQLEGAVAAEHQHIRVKGLALLHRQAVDEQALAFADAVLLATQ
jgi:hypothetical protein